MSPKLRQPAGQRGPRANRTIERILAATKEIFLARGYSGTTVDEIARSAGISRASFYTYFPSKRDVLLALGGESAHAAEVMVGYARDIKTPWDGSDVEVLVRRCFVLLDDHASFALAWTEAAQEDEEIRVAGMKRHLSVCGRMGRALGALRGRPFDDPTAQGLVLFGALERAWSYRQLYAGALKDGALEAAISAMLGAVLVPSPR